MLNHAGEQREPGQRPGAIPSISCPRFWSATGVARTGQTAMDNREAWEFSVFAVFSE